MENSTIRNPCIVGTTVRDSEVDSFLMTYHMPGLAQGLRVDPIEVVCDGKSESLMTIPMLGGGMRILGRKGNEATVSCAFVGSNAIVEAGAYVGFGCFVLGRLTGEEGLPPFTFSSEPGPERDQIGGVAYNFANIVISHFIQWNYQSNDPARAGAVARMVPCMLEEAVRAEMRRREAGEESCGNERFERYKSLKLYTDDQIEAGLAAYDNELNDGRWQMEYTDGELRFTGRGGWLIADGIARWKKEL